MRKQIFSILQYITFLGAGIFLVWWQLKGMTVTEKLEFTNAFSNTNYWIVIPIVIMSLLSHLCRSIRWKYLMEPLGYEPALKNIFSVVMIGYLANSAIPRLGEILKCTFLAKYEKLKVEKLVGTMIVERMFDLLCFVLFIGITILIQLDIIGEYATGILKGMNNNEGIPIWISLVMIAGILISFILFIKFLFKRFPHNKFIQKVNNVYIGIIEGLKAIKTLKKRKLFLMYTIFIWALYLLQVYVGFQAMEGTSHLTIKAACSVLALASLAMIVTPGGIGSFPLFVMEVLLIYNITSPLGKAFGWLMWGVSTGIVIIAGVASLILIPYINRNKNEINQ